MILNNIKQIVDLFLYTVYYLFIYFMNSKKKYNENHKNILIINITGKHYRIFPKH